MGAVAKFVLIQKCSVTKEDIRSATLGDASSCPIALALNRTEALPKNKGCLVNSGLEPIRVVEFSDSYSEPSDISNYDYDIEVCDHDREAVASFIDAYDNEDDVSPIEFDYYYN